MTTGVPGSAAILTVRPNNPSMPSPMTMLFACTPWWRAMAWRRSWLSGSEYIHDEAAASSMARMALGLGPNRLLVGAEAGTKQTSASPLLRLGTDERHRQRNVANDFG